MSVIKCNAKKELANLQFILSISAKNAVANSQFLQVTYFQSKVLRHESRGMHISIGATYNSICVFTKKIQFSYFYVNQLFSADATM